MADARTLIVKAVEDLRTQVPALAGLKLVTELELRGRGDIQLYRVAVDGPGEPDISKDVGADAKVRLAIPRADFNQLVDRGSLAAWQQAFAQGVARAEGSPQILELIKTVIDKQIQRDGLRRARQRH